jgi:hypothetical protein
VCVFSPYNFCISCSIIIEVAINFMSLDLISFPRNGNNNMADARTCEVGASLALPLPLLFCILLFITI